MNFDITCSSQADQLNRNAKEQIDDEKASALACRNLEAEITGKFAFLLNA